MHKGIIECTVAPKTFDVARWCSRPHITCACQNSTHQCRRNFLSPAVHVGWWVEHDLTCFSCKVCLVTQHPCNCGSAAFCSCQILQKQTEPLAVALAHEGCMSNIKALPMQRRVSGLQVHIVWAVHFYPTTGTSISQP